MPMLVKNNSTPLTPAPEGLYQAVCVDVVDLGMQKNPFGGADQPKIQIFWQIDQVNPENQKRFLVTKMYTASLNEKATLRKDLETWRGRKFTREEEEAGFDVEVLIGVNCQVQVVQKAKDDGRVYANVMAIVPLGKGMTKLRPEGYVRKQDRDGHAKAEAEPSPEETPF